MKETSALVVHVLADVIKIKPEYFIRCTSTVVPPDVILLTLLAVMLEVFLSFICVATWTFQKISMESKFEAYIHVRCGGVIPHTSIKAFENL